MVCVGRDLEDHLVPTLCYRQGHLPLDQNSAHDMEKPPLVPCHSRVAPVIAPGFPPSIQHDFMPLPKAHLQVISRAPRNFKKTKMSNTATTRRQAEHLQQTAQAQRRDQTPCRNLQSPLKSNCISRANAQFLCNLKA
eukprot:XP_024999707.1 leukemia NUP98 fusion partner 1 isoform X2 [Gallus gallus]